MKFILRKLGIIKLKKAVANVLVEKRGVICLAISMLLIGYTTGFRTHNPVVSVARFTADFYHGGAAYAKGELKIRMQQEIQRQVAAARVQAREEGKQEFMADFEANPNKYLKYNDKTGEVGFTR